ncbi:MAG: hypothetical protein MUC87_01350 [Bacteroidia bacterium]|jgi:hypothetical protein|nr:hypothetical protein [Bacteroidia bacterium]
MKTSWITHKGYRIYFVDFSGLNPKEMIALLDQSFAEIEKEPGQVRMLGNYANTSISPRFIDKYADWGKKLKTKTELSAVFGLNFAKRVMLNTFNAANGMNIKAFETKEEALEHLTKS